MVASEAAPFAKTGGLADVVGSLPLALRALGHDVRLVMPWYRAVRKATGNLVQDACKLPVQLGGTIYQAGFRESEINGLPVYFIDLPEFYDRPELYGEHGVDYPDNAERFALLSMAALELARQVRFIPDVVHAHDWQAGLVPVYLKQQCQRDNYFAGTATLFTIHNLGYQGVFPRQTGQFLGLDEKLLTADGLEYHGQISLLKSGIRFSDQVNTVSPTYCREIQTAEHGIGLDGLMRSRSERLHGLLNGLDGSLWSPDNDQALSQSYHAQNLSGKVACKKALQQELGLKDSARTPIVAMVTRIDAQKGIELLLECWDELLAHDLQLVILGTGNPDLEHRLAEAASFYPGQVKVLICFNDLLSRRIYAGSDLFLMPSRYEPCGLGQLIALRYGSVPVVHATGGLVDTITDPQVSEDQANGFVFHAYLRHSLLEGLNRALKVYAEPQNWKRLMLRGMTQNFSWAHAAGQYVDLYRLCINSLA